MGESAYFKESLQLLKALDQKARQCGEQARQSTAAAADARAAEAAQRQCMLDLRANLARQQEANLRGKDILIEKARWAAGADPAVRRKKFSFFELSTAEVVTDFSPSLGCLA